MYSNLFYLPVIEQKKKKKKKVKKGKKKDIKFSQASRFVRKGTIFCLPWKMCWAKGSNLISRFRLLLFFFFFLPRDIDFICLLFPFFFIDRPIKLSSLPKYLHLMFWLVMQNWFVSRLPSSPASSSFFFFLFLSCPCSFSNFIIMSLASFCLIIENQQLGCVSSCTWVPSCVLCLHFDLFCRWHAR